MGDKDLMLKMLTATPRQVEAIKAILDGKNAPDGGGEERRLVHLTQTARMLGISRPTVSRLIEAGALETVRLCGVRRVTMRSINAYLARTSRAAE